MDCRKWGLALVVTGVIGQVAGLALDASLHGTDDSLLGRDGAFTFSNVGHALLFAGLALVVAGVGLVLAGPYLYGVPGRPPASRLSQLVAPLALVALLGGGAILADASSADQATPDGGSGSAVPVRVAAAVAHRDASGGVHQHAEGAPVVGSGPAAAGIEVANGSSPCEQSGPPVSEGQAAGGHGHRGPVAQQPITDPAVRAELGRQLAAARAAALALPTAADALAAGYKRVTPYLPCIGAHYMQFSFVDRTLDPSHP